jgi:hypothetical protein
MCGISRRTKYNTRARTRPLDQSAPQARFGLSPLQLERMAVVLSGLQSGCKSTAVERNGSGAKIRLSAQAYQKDSYLLLNAGVLSAYTDCDGKQEVFTRN